MTFAQWKRKATSLQAAYLFVNFFPEVNRAWKRAQFTYTDEAEAVSIALQYLNKNVKKILDSPNRYSAAYVYQVCFNCIRSLHWRKRDINRNNCETSATVVKAGKEYNILDFVPDSSTCDSVQIEYNCDSVEDVLRHMGKKYENVAYHLANPQVSLKRTASNNKNYCSNPFSCISISEKEAAKLELDIQDVLTNYILDCRPDLLSYIS